VGCISIDIDREDVELVGHARAAQEIGRVFARDEGVHEPQLPALELGGKLRLNGANGARVGFEPEALPSFPQQIGRVRFDAMAGADLDKETVADANAAKNLAGDPVLTVLREHLSLEMRQVARVGIPCRLEQL
jgi:hypothetical protein